MLENDQYTPELLPAPILIEEVIKHCVRCPRVFNAAYGNLKPTHFSKQGETGYRYVLAATIEHFEKYAELPTHIALSTVVLTRLHADSGILAEAIKDVEEFILWLWQPGNDLETDNALEWLRVVLKDRIVTQPLLREVEKVRIGGGTDLPSFVQDVVRNLENVAAIGIDVPTSSVPKVWQNDTDMRLVPTGIPFIDSRLDGGMKPGDVNVLLGPTGVGKTTLGMQLVVEGGRAEAAKARETNVKGKRNVFFSYEIDMEEMQVRMMTYAAQINKSRLEHLNAFEELSRRGDLQDYEKKRWKRQLDEGVDIPGEWDRWKAAEPWLDDYVTLMDMSADQGGVARGNGGIAELRSTLDAMHHQDPRGFNVIMIDWAGMVARQYLRAQGGKVDTMYTHELTDFVSRVRRQIAKPYNCQVWILHQLSGQSNKKSPTAKMSHADAEGCALFAVNAWFAFCLGNKDQATNTCLLAATKTRRGEGKDAVVCKIDGAFGQLVDADRQYAIDHVTNKIVKRYERDQFTEFGNGNESRNSENVGSIESMDERHY